MYIEPFWAGVFTVVATEVILILIAAIVSGLKKKK